MTALLDRNVAADLPALAPYATDWNALAALPEAIDHATFMRDCGVEWTCPCASCDAARGVVAERAVRRPQTEAERRRAGEIEDAEAGDDLLRAAGVEIVA